MKQLSYLFLGLGAFLLSSCSQEDVFDPTLSGGESAVTFTIEAPAGFQSRAFGDGTTAQNLKYQLYKLDSEGNFTVIKDEGEGFAAKITDFTGSKTLQFSLIKGDSYRLVAVAAGVMGGNNSGAYFPEYKDNSARLLSNGSGRDNVKGEEGDLFYGYSDFTVGGDFNGKLVLTRGVAQINIGASDFAIAQKLGMTDIKNVAVTVKAQPSIIDLITGKVSNTTYDIKHSSNIIGTPNPFPVEGNDYLGIAYVIVGEEQATYDITLTYNYTLNGKTMSESRIIGSVPMQRNRRTNIYGSLLTSSYDYTIEITDDFGGEDLEADPFFLALVNGGTGSLTTDATLSRSVIVNKSTDVDLNGNKIISNIVYNAITAAKQKETMSPIYVESNGNLTINGEKEGSGMYAPSGKNTRLITVWGGEVTINGGTYEAEDNGEIIYIGDTGGTVYITGGTFKNGWSSANGTNFLINAYDAARKEGTAKFIISGGTFYNWNPVNPASDPDANWLAPGYKVESRQEGNDLIYTVIPEDYVMVGSEQDIISALNNGSKNLVLEPKDYVFTDKTFYDKGNQTFHLVSSDVTIEGNGAVFKGSYSPNFLGATIKNVTFDALEDENPTFGAFNGNFVNCSFKGGVNTESKSLKSTFTNCKFICDPNFNKRMAFHIGIVDEGNTIELNNCTIDGRCDFGVNGEIDFNNCILYIKGQEWGLYNNGKLNFNSCTIAEGSKDMVVAKGNGAINWQ